MTFSIPLGSHISPLLFNIFINNVLFCYFSLSRPTLQDDAKVFYTISKFENSLIFQQILDKCINWCNVAELSFNIDSCLIMSFHRTHEVDDGVDIRLLS